MTHSPTDDHARLNRRYTHVRTEYDALARRYKRRRTQLWFVTLIATWGPLLCAIVGLGGLLDPRWNRFLLHGVIPVLGTTNFAVNVLQVITSPRGRWLEYRAATEQLREQAMRFRAGLPPYNGPDADARFDHLLDGLTRRLGRDDPNPTHRSPGPETKPENASAARLKNSGSAIRIKAIRYYRYASSEFRR